MRERAPDFLVGEPGDRVVGKRVPPPQGVQPAVSWGSEERVTELLGEGCAELRMQRRECPWRYPSTQACLEHFQAWYGPTVAAFAAVGEDGRAGLEAELLEVFARHSTADDGTFAADVDYLEVVAVRA